MKVQMKLLWCKYAEEQVEITLPDDFKDLNPCDQEYMVLEALNRWDTLEGTEYDQPELVDWDYISI